MSEADTLSGNPGVLPHNLDAERAVLGAILLAPQITGDVAQILEAEDFYNPGHRWIFSAALTLYESQGSFDPILVGEELRSMGKLEEAGGEEYLDSLPLSVSSHALVEDYARLIREKSLLRKLWEAGTRVGQLALRGGEKLEVILDKAEQLVFDLAQRLHHGEARSVMEILKDFYEKIDRLRDREARMTGLQTGFADLDDLTAGLHAGELIIVAGRPSMGKTSFANNLVDRLSVDQGIPGAIFSLEVSSEQVVQNILCIHGRLDAQRLRHGFISKAEMEKLRNTASRIYEAPIYVDESQGLNTLGIRHKARRLVKAHGIKYIIIDYLQLMEGDRWARAEGRQQEISRISRSLKALARELEIPVIALSQLNRAVEQRDDHRPRMSDLRESGSIEQDADVVLLLHREEYFKPTEENRGVAEIIVAKQRNGPTGTVRLHFEKRCMRFDSLADPNAQAGLG